MDVEHETNVSETSGGTSTLAEEVIVEDVDGDAEDKIEEQKTTVKKEPTLEVDRKPKPATPGGSDVPVILTVSHPTIVQVTLSFNVQIAYSFFKGFGPVAVASSITAYKSIELLGANGRLVTPGQRLRILHEGAVVFSTIGTKYRYEH